MLTFAIHALALVGAVALGGAAIGIAVVTAIAGYEKWEWSRERRVLEDVMGELTKLDRWCAEDETVVAVVERLRRVAKRLPVEHIGEWRNKYCPLPERTHA